MNGQSPGSRWWNWRDPGEGTGRHYTHWPLCLVGLIYEPSEKFYLDCGVRAGLNERSEDYALLAGFGHKF